ncbi:heat shock protein HspQ [Aquabacter spiritensis]|uniref:Heat shock protein HspQ n=1 Tax=Aquabacter spiritensis TaxID=933073 RepID=A0A4R3LST5_9HYPH|nr:heat shock protein HspQ [Aquabacter spiritensis]
MPHNQKPRDAAPLAPARRRGAITGGHALVAETPRAANAFTPRLAKFRIGEVVRHKHFPFRGVVFDVDPVFDNTEEWWLAIPEEIRPHKDQPFYHLFAENAESEYVAYVSEQNLERDNSDEPVRHPQVAEALAEDGEGGWQVRRDLLN